MKLPNFESPSLAELRAWWRSRDENAVKRLILETQRYRLALLDMRDLIDNGVQYARAVNPELVKAGEPLMTLRIRIAQEVLRIGDIDDTPPIGKFKYVSDYARTAESLSFEREVTLRREADERAAAVFSGGRKRRR
jgi:hypothetical protein